MDGKLFKSAGSLGFTSSAIWITPFQSNDLAPIDPAGNSLATAFNVGNLAGTVTYRDRISASDPEDYFQFTLTAISDLTLSISGLSAVQLLNSSGTVISSLTTLSSGTYYVRVFGGSGDYTLTLAADPPPLPTITIAATNPNASESNTNGSFTVSRTGPSTAPLAIADTISGTATNGTDYSLVTGSAIIPVGQSSITIPITVLDDLLIEGNETVILTLSTSSSYTIGTGTATVTIADNDQAPTLPTVSISASTNAAEPSIHGSFTISRTGSTAQALTVSYAVAGTAANGTDYQTLGQTGGDTRRPNLRYDSGDCK
jgi:hypothetical protein